jgi:hypothetical protein
MRIGEIPLWSMALLGEWLTFFSDLIVIFPLTMFQEGERELHTSSDTPQPYRRLGN